MVCNVYCVQENPVTFACWLMGLTVYFTWSISRLLPIFMENFFLTFLFTKFEDINLLVKIPKLDTSVVIIWTSFCAETKSLLLSSISVFFILNAFESFIVTQLWSFTFLNNVASEFTPLPTFVIAEMLYLKHLKRNSLGDRVHFHWSTNKY